MPLTDSVSPAAPGSVRKADHLRIAAGAGVTHAVATGLDEVRLRHRALPERDLRDVGLGARLLGVELAAPIVISAMTGGTAAAAAVNQRLARAAAEHGIALTLGSGRQLLDAPDLLHTYRDGARPPLLLANLGAGEIRRPDGPERAQRLVDLLDADGLSVHLNPIQEAVQPEGQPSFSSVAERLAAVVERLAPRPVVVKEVGFGMDGRDVALLARAGVAAVDIAGAGGTNWALVEGRRDASAGELAAAFADWGVPTVVALAEARAAAPGLEIIASGGVRSGVDVAKCLALGAQAAGLARPLLIAAQGDRASEALGILVEQLRIATWTSGAASVDELSADHLRGTDAPGERPAVQGPAS